MPDSLNNYKNDNLIFKLFFSLALLFTTACGLWSCLHYSGRNYGNNISWIGWLAGMTLFITALMFLNRSERKKLNYFIGFDRRTLIIIAVLSVVFIISHLWNFSTAPWNQNGLFDDAAWNIYYAFRYILTDQPFQAAFFDHGIAREVIFHYYITFLFRIFGYNLLTFNISVMMLGFITWLFTIMLIQRLFNNRLVTILAAFIMNFFPLHFLFSFVGQRYAMVPPLLISSLYFLYTGFRYKSYAHTAVASVLAGLCFSSGIMGKQYVMGLAGSLIMFIVFNFKKSFTFKNWRLTQLFVLGFIIAALPMLIYIAYNSKIYFANESGYTQKFINALTTNGWSGINEYFIRMKDCLFGTTYYKWFIPDYPLIPLQWYIFLIPGFFIAFIKKNYQFIALALIAPVGAFISGFSDYRVLISCPIWIILIAYTIDVLTKSDYKTLLIKPAEFMKKNTRVIAGLIFSFVVFIWGIVPCMNYINIKSKDPFSVYFFAQKDVALSRFVRDIAAGIDNPSPSFRHNEFKMPEAFEEKDFDVFICQNLGYAITHTFLYYYNDREIMSFSDQLPFNLLSQDHILEINKNVLLNYNGNKNLKLVWEANEKTQPVIDKFKELSYLGSGEILEAVYEGRDFRIFILDIKRENVAQLKSLVKDIKL